MILIGNITDLQKIGNDPGYLLSDDYALSNDIDASATAGWNGGDGFDPIGSSASPFTGTFDGQGYSITDLHIGRGVVDGVPSYISLFAYISGATIQDVDISNCDITVTESIPAGTWTVRMAALVGVAVSSNISGCTSSGTVNSNITKVGIGLFTTDLGMSGIVGESQLSNISNCQSSCIISQPETDIACNSAGFIFKNTGTITNCESTGDITTSYQDCSGFVYYNEGTIEDSHASCDLTCADDSGGFVWQNEASGIIRRCYSEGSAIGTTAGDSKSMGFCAWYNYGLIEDSYSTMDVVGLSDAAGFLYQNRAGGQITGCYCTGNVSESDDEAAGFVISNQGDIDKCYCTGTVEAADDAGGFAADNSGDIENCYSWSDVTAIAPFGDDVGGFVESNSGNITNCYSIGALSAPGDIGGFCRSDSGSIVSCYWDTDTSGAATSDGGTGKTTIEMKKQATFIGWDFGTPIWYIVEDVTYPTFEPGPSESSSESASASESASESSSESPTPPPSGVFSIITFGPNTYLKKLRVKDFIVTENTSFINDVETIDSFGISSNLDVEIKNAMIYCKNADVDFSPNDSSINLYGYGITVRTPGVFSTFGPSSVCSINDSAIKADSLSDV